jgi:thiamine biosynthesis protein ThiS
MAVKSLTIMRTGAGVTVNGQRHHVKPDETVAQLLHLLEIPPGRVAVELDKNILKKDLWDETRLRGGEQLEIVHFVGGG